MTSSLHTKSYRLVGMTLYVVADPDTLTVVSSSFRDDAIARSPKPHDVKNVRSISGVDEAVSAYNDGVLDALDHIRVSQPGGPFQQRVWTQMRSIGPGRVESYGELAARAGNANAYRAVGTACAQNTVAPFVPCHRVVAANGLGGYGYGIDVKIALLEHEGALHS